MACNAWYLIYSQSVCCQQVWRTLQSPIPIHNLHMLCWLEVHWMDMLSTHDCSTIKLEHQRRHGIMDQRQSTKTDWHQFIYNRLVEVQNQNKDWFKLNQPVWILPTYSTWLIMTVMLHYYGKCSSLRETGGGKRVFGMKCSIWWVVYLRMKRLC